MKIFISFFLCALMAFVDMQAQDDSRVITSDTTIISWRKREFVIVKDDDGTHMSIRRRENEWKEEEDDRRDRRAPTDVDFFAFDIGLTNYYQNGLIGSEAVDPDFALKTFRPGSHLGLHFFPTQVRFDRAGYFSLKTAITLDLNKYNFQEPITLVPGEETITYLRNDSISYDKNKLTANYVQIPLMLTFNTHPRSDKGLKISIGGYAGFLYGSKLKQEADNGDKVKIKDAFNLNPFRYGLTARFDFHWLDLYLNYNLSTLFEEGQNPSTQVFTAGINLIDF